MNCPLCESLNIRPYHKDQCRSYHQCDSCSLVFVSREFLVSSEIEQRRYELHECDEGYADYLKKIGNVLLPHFEPQSRGLDFGCGKTLILQEFFEEKGFFIDSFDLYFHNRQEIFSKNYDFIILSEVIEHLRSPILELKRVTSLLNPGGRLAVKTKLLPSRENFENWFYKRDITHIQFFNQESLSMLQNLLGFETHKVLENDLFLFRNGQ